VRHLPRRSLVAIARRVRQRLAYNKVFRPDLGMFSDDGAVRAVSIHALNVPDRVIVGDGRAEDVAPAPGDALRYEVVIDFPILTDGFDVATIPGISIPGGVQGKMDAIARRVVVGVIEIRDVVEFVGRHE